ncbi:hypothetical protein BH11CYA1_BH11CYA1_28810 [soil metagenome]
MPKQQDSNLVASRIFTSSSLSLGISIAIGTALLAAPAWSQSIMEAGGLHAGVAGLGAGLAASQNHGAAVRSTYEVAAQAQQAILAQNKAVEQYLTLGTKYEAKKDWAAAEKCYSFVLQVVNRRDGPGSANGLPALKHLVSVNVAQNKITDAINFQKTVVAFTERSKTANPQAVIQTKLDLSNLFIRQSDYTSAEPYLQQSAAVAEHETAIPIAQRKVTLTTYSTVLRKLKKTSEADAIEAVLAAQGSEETKQPSSEQASKDSAMRDSTVKEPALKEQTSQAKNTPESASGKTIEKTIEKSIQPPQPPVESKASTELK